MWRQYYSIHSVSLDRWCLCVSDAEGNSRVASPVTPDTHQRLPVTFLWHALSQEEQPQISNGREGRREDVGWTGLGGVEVNGRAKARLKGTRKAFFSLSDTKAKLVKVSAIVHAQKCNRSELLSRIVTCKAVFAEFAHCLCIMAVQLLNCICCVFSCTDPEREGVAGKSRLVSNYVCALLPLFYTFSHMHHIVPVVK